jgi:uncharacterized protein (TIGR04562 family)
MGKSRTQAEFGAFVDESNAIATVRHGVRGLGSVINIPDPSKVPQSQILDLLAEEICALAQSAVDNESPDGNPTISLRGIIAADIRKLLKPFEADDKKGPISMLDVVTLGLTDAPDIKRFLKRHGSDIDKPKDFAYVQRVLQRAISYFDKNIANSAQEKVHPTLRNTNNLDGISYIFQTAAGKHQRQLIAQACGLLRITAAIDFLNRDPLLALLSSAEESLRQLHKDHFVTKNGKLYFDTRKPGEIPIEIISCEVRTKEEDSIITKLLHKPQNNTKEVVDHEGMRVVTKTAFDALKFFYYAFFKHDTAIFPGFTFRMDEVKQKLFGEAKLMEALQDPNKAKDLLMAFARHTDDNEDFEKEDDAGDGVNKFSSKRYKALQVTFDLPITDKDGNRRHFPIEVQIADRDSMRVNETEAPHEEYKARQKDAVKKRLLRNNLDTKFRQRKKD